MTELERAIREARQRRWRTAMRRSLEVHLTAWAVAGAGLALLACLGRLA